MTSDISMVEGSGGRGEDIQCSGCRIKGHLLPPVLVLDQDRQTADETAQLDGQSSIQWLLWDARDRLRKTRPDQADGGVDGRDKGGQEGGRATGGLQDPLGAHARLAQHSMTVEEERRDGVDGEVDRERVEEGPDPALERILLASAAADRVVHDGAVDPTDSGRVQCSAVISDRVSRAVCDCKRPVCSLTGEEVLRESPRPRRS